MNAAPMRLEAMRKVMGAGTRHDMSWAGAVPAIDHQAVYLKLLSKFVD